MNKLFSVALAAALTLGLSTSAFAQKIDANGRCHDAAGKFAKAEVCGGAKAAPTKKDAATPAPMAAKAAPAKAARCKDAKGKFAKCGTPGAVPAA